jgi:hypothetical protein
MFLEPGVARIHPIFAVDEYLGCLLLLIICTPSEDLLVDNGGGHPMLFRDRSLK